MFLFVGTGESVKATFLHGQATSFGCLANAWMAFGTPGGYYFHPLTNRSLNLIYCMIWHDASCVSDAVDINMPSWICNMLMRIYSSGIELFEWEFRRCLRNPKQLTWSRVAALRPSNPINTAATSPFFSGSLRTRHGSVSPEWNKRVHITLRVSFWRPVVATQKTGSLP